jgi:hypothetical protein
MSISFSRYFEYRSCVKKYLEDSATKTKVENIDWKIITRLKLKDEKTKLGIWDKSKRKYLGTNMGCSSLTFLLGLANVTAHKCA